MEVTRDGEPRYAPACRSGKEIPRPADPGPPDPLTNAKEHCARDVDAPEQPSSLARERAHQPPPRWNDPLMLPGIELDDDPVRIPGGRSRSDRAPGNPLPRLELPGKEVEQRRLPHAPGPVEVHEEG